jgi:hypothetical protein
MIPFGNHWPFDEDLSTLSGANILSIVIDKSEN